MNQINIDAINDKTETVSLNQLQKAIDDSIIPNEDSISDKKEAESIVPPDGYNEIQKLAYKECIADCVEAICAEREVDKK